MAENKKTVVYPDYIAPCSDEAKHKWLQWRSLKEKIDTHALRFYTVASEKSGKVRTFDCKGAKGMILKWAREMNAGESDLKELERRCVEIQLLKVKKGALNRAWAKEVYGDKKKGDEKIFDIRFTEIIDLFGSWYTVDEVYKIIVDKWGFSLNFKKLQYFYQQHKSKIEKKKADYVLKFNDFRLVTDTGRMEVLSKIAYELERKFDKNQSLEVAKELRSVMEQIRKEVKGDELKLTIDGKIDINATLQANKSLEDSLSMLPINSIVIGLTAAKQGINPSSMIGFLTNSYYSQFNGFNSLTDPSKIDYPGKYIKTYNWKELEEKNKLQIEDVEPISETLNITDKHKVTTSKKKNELLKLLKSYKERNNNV
jgi:hypothetical protein